VSILQRAIPIVSLTGMLTVLALTVATSLPASAACAPTPAPAAAPLKIGIIGTGHIGGALATLWVGAGYEVMMSSRHPEELQALAHSLGPRAHVGTPREAAQFGEVLLISVPYGALPQVGRDLKSELAGKIVLDTGNPYPERDGQMAVEARRKGTGVASADYLPGVRLVRAALISGSRRWLPLNLGNALIEAGPARRARGPDRHCRPRQLRVIESAGAHEREVRPRRGAGEEVRSALWAEAPQHGIAAVGDAVVFAQLAAHREGIGWEADVHRAAASPYVLTDAAPADPGDDGGGTDRVTYCPAQAATADVHGGCSLERDKAQEHQDNGRKAHRRIELESERTSIGARADQRGHSGARSSGACGEYLAAALNVS